MQRFYAGKTTVSDLSAAKLDCRILLAEDGPDNQRLITYILKRAGADVTVVENGLKAVEKVMGRIHHRREDDPSAPFDIVLMDMSMPVMDGYRAAGQLRNQGYDGPIVALTAHAMATDRKKCIDAGCNDYAVKPIDRQKLVETIRRNLRQPASRQEGRGNGNILISDVADDPDFAGLLEMFAADLPENITAIQRALAEQDWNTLKRLAHRLQGAAGSFGFPAIAEVAAELEGPVLEMDDLERLRTKVEELTDLCGRVRAKPPAC